MSNANPLLDLEVSSRGASWRFELYEGNDPMGRLTLVDRDSPPQLSVDVSRSIKRTLTNVSLIPNEIDEIDVVKWSLKLIMELDDGTVWPQGVFRWADVSRPVFSSMNGVTYTGGECSLVDQLMIVDQKLDRSVSYSPGKIITDAISELLAELPITYTVQESPAVISPTAEAISWTIGTSRLKIINELALMIGYHEFYFDNNGDGQLGPMPDPLSVLDDEVLMYPTGSRVFLGSLTRSTNLLELPNRFIVVNNGATSVPVYGSYDVPPDAPHSFENRGFFVTHVEQLQGIASQADAQYAAESLGKQWRFPFETVEFAGPPDPRHDHFNVIELDGDKFLELSWSMNLKDGSDMTHTARRTYGPQEADV